MAELALSESLRKILDGESGSSPLAGLATKVKLGTRLNDLAAGLIGLAAVVLQVAAIGAENTDVQIPVEVLGGTADAGTWTKAITSAGARTVTRTANASTQSYWMEVAVRIRTASGKGFKLRGAKTVYSVGTADATDVRTEVYKRVVPADNAAPAAATLLGGDQNAHYDSAHDSAAERGDDTAAPENHTSTMTLPTPAYFADGEVVLIRFVVTDPGTSVVILKDLVLFGSETLVDLA